MKLTGEQIAMLFQFCEKKYVRYYDLQLELVDHLASRIEEEMEADANLSFEDALQKVYKGFGIFGFAHIVRDKENALIRSHNKIWWRAFWSYFNIPKLALTLFLFALFYTAGSYLAPDIRSIVTSGGILIGYIYLGKQLSQFRRLTTKRTLLMLATGASAPAGIIFFYPQFLLFNENIEVVWPYALAATIAIILELAIIDFNRKIYKDALRLYPEAFAKA